MASLYADEDFDFPVVEELRRLGNDVLTAFEAGQANQKISDVAVLAFATAASRAVLTRNRRHFVRLHRQGIAHAGIIACSADNDFAALASRIHQAITSVPSLNGQLLAVYRPP